MYGRTKPQETKLTWRNAEYGLEMINDLVTSRVAHLLAQEEQAIDSQPFCNHIAPGEYLTRGNLRSTVTTYRECLHMEKSPIDHRKNTTRAPL